jgi:hypothetical protein
MNWPKSLITELAARRCIVFLGAGASAGSIGQDGVTRPPTWNAFLQGLIANIQHLSSQNQLIIEDLMNKDKYLDAAEVIYELTSKADFSTLIRNTFDIPRFKQSSIHESIIDIDPKVVITTNYDKIYDNYCTITTGSATEGYNVSKYYEDHLVSDLRSPVRIIIKAHGCVSDPGKIILTKSQYFEARKKFMSFYQVLDSLFLSNTILFIGYSLNDPDIALILENVNIKAPSLHPHYFVMEDNVNSIIKKSNQNSYNLEFIEFPAGDFSELYRGLVDLKNQVVNERASNPGI